MKDKRLLGPMLVMLFLAALALPIPYTRCR